MISSPLNHLSCAPLGPLQYVNIFQTCSTQNRTQHSRWGGLTKAEYSGTITSHDFDNVFFMMQPKITSTFFDTATSLLVSYLLKKKHPDLFHTYYFCIYIRLLYMCAFNFSYLKCKTLHFFLESP